MFEFIKSLLSLIIFITPGIIISCYFFKKADIIQRIFYGFCISTTTAIIFGFIFSCFEIFKIYYVIGLFLFLNLCGILISFYFKKKYNYKLFKFSKNYKIFLIIILISIILFSFHGFYENLNESTFPVAFDRGNHFARTINLIYNGHFWDIEPGTSYRAFYPQGMYAAFGTFSLINSFIDGRNIAEMEYSDFLALSRYLVFFYGIIISLLPLAAYSVTSKIFNNVKISLIAAIISIYLSASLLSAGTMGSNLGVLLAGLIIILSFDFVKTKNNKKLYLLFIPLISSIYLIHPQPTILVLLLPVFIFIFALINKDIKFRKLISLFFLLSISLIIALAFQYITHKELFLGIVDEMQRKLIPQAPTFYSSTNSVSKSFAQRSIENIIEYIKSNIVYLILLLTGMYFVLKDKKKYIAGLIIGAIFLSVFPLFPLPNRVIYYYFYPLIILLTYGAYKFLRKFDLREYIFSIIFLTIIFYQGINQLNDSSLGLNQWIAPDYIYFQAFNNAEWIIQNLDKNKVIAYYDGGPIPHVVHNLTPNVYYFSDNDCCRDTPSLLEINRLYLDNVEIENKIKIIKKYEINAIIISEKRTIDIDKLKDYYPDVRMIGEEDIKIIILY